MIRTLQTATVCLLALAIPVGIVYYRVLRPPEPMVEADKPKSIPVRVQTVHYVDSWNSRVLITGLVKPKRRSELTFERVGRVDEVFVNKGDFVKLGQVLARQNTDLLDSQLRKLQAERLAALAALDEMKAGPRRENIDAAKAKVSEVDAQLRAAKLVFERRQRLLNTDAISREDFEQSQSLVEQLTAAKSNAQKTLEELELGTRQEKIATQEAILESLNESIFSVKVELDHSILVAPYSGVITERFIDEGHVSSPGVNVFSISESQALEAHFGIPPQAAAKLAIGSELEVEVRGQKLKSKIILLVPEVEERTRTVRVVAAIDPLDSGMVVMSGDLVRLEISSPKKVDGCWLPSSAVIQGVRGLWECFVVESLPDCEEGKVTRRAVEVLETEGTNVLVRGSLFEGERVVASALHRLVDGQPVTIAETNAP